MVEASPYGLHGGIDQTQIAPSWRRVEMREDPRGRKLAPPSTIGWPNDLNLNQASLLAFVNDVGDWSEAQTELAEMVGIDGRRVGR